MSLHPDTFGYLKPTDKQQTVMNDLRQRAAVYAQALDAALPAGPDKTFILRQLREVAMWVNVAVTRHPDGAPRLDVSDVPPQEYPADHPVKGDLGSVPL